MKIPSMYDTMTRTVVPLQSADGKTFRFYCCGPTVYGPAHVGNFRTFVVQDLLRRVIEAAGMTTMHVRNVTDVDDKTIRQSQAEGKTLVAFTDFWLSRFRADCTDLHLLPPHVEPGAVAHIDIQIKMVERLIEKQHAYVAEDGSVYYRVDSFASYGRLSRLQEREITTSCGPACAGHSDDEYDRESAADFALWKAHKPEDGDNAWPSPWGPGRPGWHLECSAMSREYLGDSFDLHGGGVDLVFPHHENEIAQSEACSGKTLARIWFHSAHLMVEGQKMSKSLGNLYTLDDVRARGFEPIALRYVLLAGHYRQPLNFTWDSLKAAQSALRRLQKTLNELSRLAAPSAIDPEMGAEAGDFFLSVYEALADNLNTPEALGRLFTALHGLERRMNAQDLSADDARRACGDFRRVLDLFGFELDADAAEVSIPEDIRRMAEKRWAAKQQRDFAEADALRGALLDRGWAVRDAKDGYEITPATP